MADPIFALARGLAQRVEVRIIAVAENAALFQREWRIIDNALASFSASAGISRMSFCS